MTSKTKVKLQKEQVREEDPASLPDRPLLDLPDAAVEALFDSAVQFRPWRGKHKPHQTQAGKGRRATGFLPIRKWTTGGFDDFGRAQCALCIARPQPFR